MRFAPTEHIEENLEINDKKYSFISPKDYKNPPSYSKNDIIDKWGKPDYSGFHENCNYITYRDGFKWNFITIVILIIPIPILIFPTGFDEKKIYFLDDKSMAYSENYRIDSHFFGYLCDDRSCRLQFGKTYHYNENEAKLAKCKTSKKIDSL
ncbi:hypothetical protein JWG40_10465 [Leptospira sp. 201903074]|nr:hypothetical protein [Leptospira abararensis]